MDRDEWKKRIIESCQAAGTYRPFFDSAIETLAGIMENRDDAQKRFEESGGESVIEHINTSGATNIVKNPALVVVDDLNKTALAYWRDLGLTPAGLKRINEKAMEEKSGRASFADVLRDIGI